MQPAIPFNLSDDWNLITRTIVPVIYQESPARGVDCAFGLGDTVQSFFLSPVEEVGGWILGAGPVWLWPTGTSPEVRSEQLGMGPTIVALQQRSGFTYGLLANHLWNVTEPEENKRVDAGQPISLTAGGRCYAEAPHRGPEWGARFVVTLLFPK